MPAKKKVSTLNDTQKLRKMQLEKAQEELGRHHIETVNELESYKNSVLRGIRSAFFKQLTTMTEQEKKMPFHAWIESLTDGKDGDHQTEQAQQQTHSAAAGNSAGGATGSKGKRTAATGKVVVRKRTAVNGPASSGSGSSSSADSDGGRSAAVAVTGSAQQDANKATGMSKTPHQQPRNLLNTVFSNVASGSSSHPPDSSTPGGALQPAPAEKLDLTTLPRETADIDSQRPIMAYNRHGEVVLLVSPNEILTTIASKRQHGLVRGGAGRK